MQVEGRNGKRRRRGDAQAIQGLAPAEFAADPAAALIESDRTNELVFAQEN